jgi:anti-sigma-K factor RskA
VEEPACSAEEVGVIVTTGMRPLPAGKAYQAWALIDGRPVSLGLIDMPEAGRGFVLLSKHVTRADPVFITIEQRGGAPSPTGAAVLSTGP